MDLLNRLFDFVAHAIGLLGFVIAWAAVLLAGEHHDQLKKLEEKVDYLADHLYEVEGVGDVSTEREERH